MGNNYSPKIVTDGLVLCLDAHDAKSYAGQPVTNLSYSGSGDYQYLVQGYDWNNSGTCIRNNNVTDMPKPNIGGAGNSAAANI